MDNQAFFNAECQAAIGQVASMTVDDDNDPDKAARSLQLADSTGVPAEQILPNIDNFEAQHRAVLNSDLVSSNRFLSDYINSHPLAARISHDDMAGLDTASDSISRVGGGSYLEQARRYLSLPSEIGEAAARGATRGFAEGFGKEPVGSWMGPEYWLRYPASATLAYLETGLPEIGLRSINGLFRGLTEAVHDAVAKGVPHSLNGEMLANDLAGLTEAEAMGLSGRHAPPAPELTQVIRGAVRAAEPYLRQGEMPPTGVHPFIDSMYKVAAEDNAKALDEAVRDSNATATHERSPEMYSRFAEGPAANTKIKVDANAIAQLYGDKAPEADDGLLGWIPNLGERLDATAGSGGYIDVPLKDWLANIDPDVHKELRDDILVGDHGFTVNEAQGVEDFKAPEKAEPTEDEAKPEEEPPIVDHMQPQGGPVQTVREGAALNPLLAIGDRKLSLQKRPARITDEGIIKSDEFKLLNENGESVGWLEAIPYDGGKRIYIDNIGGLESKGYHPNSFGPSLVRSLVQQLKQAYPDMEAIGGFRISGAREAAGTEKEAWINIRKEALDEKTYGDFKDLLASHWEDLGGGAEGLFRTDDRGLAANSFMGQIVLRTLQQIAPQALSDVAHGLKLANDQVYGLYLPDMRQIIVSLESPAPMRTARHEGLHSLRDMGLFTAEEWRTLEASALEEGWMNKYNISSRYAESTSEIQVEEAIAHAYGEWRGGADAPKAVHPIFEKIKEFFTKLLDAVKQRLGFDGVDTWQEIFDRIDTGEIGTRDAMTEGEGAPRAQRPDEPAPIPVRMPFTKGKAIGIREDIYRRYMKLIEQRHAQDLKHDFEQAYDAERRTQTKEWKENEAAVREQVQTELGEKPNILVDKLMSERAGEFKIDPMSLREDLREVLPKEYMRRTNSMSADDLAGYFGYPSGDALVEHLAELAKDRQASGLTHKEYVKKLEDDEVQRRMESQYGWLEKNVLEEAKDRALSQNQIDILHEETLALAEQAGQQLPLERSAIERELRSSFNQTPVGEISSAMWLKASGRAGREAEEALLKNDPSEAFKAKQRQHNAVLQAKWAHEYEKAQKQLDRTAKRMGKLQPGRGEATPIEPEYLNHIQDLLYRVGYSQRRSLANVRENIARQSAKTVQQFVEAKLAESGGYRDIPLAEFLWDPGFATPLEKLTAEQFFDFKNTIDGLVREGRDEQRIFREGEAYDKAQVIGEMRNQLHTFSEKDIPHGYEPGLARQYIAGSTSIETLMNRWDRNDPRGVFNKFVVYPLASAANAESKLEREMTVPYRALPEVGDLKKLIASPLDPQIWRYSNFTRENLLGLIQNAGNRSNWITTARGWGADPKDLWDWLVQNSTKEDWLRAQQLGKTIFSKLIDMADRNYERRYGSTTDKIPLTPFELEFANGDKVQLDGWYHPLIPDPTWQGKQPLRGGAYADRDYNHVATSNGYTRSRTGSIYPVDLSFSKIPQLMKQQIHDIAFRDAVLDVDKVFRDSKLRNDVTQFYGKEYTDLLMPYLRNVAGQQAVPSELMQRLGAASEYIRQNTIGTYIGFNPYTVMKHAPTAAFMSMGDVGAARMLWAYKNLWREASPDGSTWWDFALAHSEELQRRERNWQEAMASVQKQTYGESTARERMLQWGSWPVALSDKFSAVPLWVARFDKSLGEGSSVGEAIDLADRSVRRQHGSTAVTNQPLLVQGGGPLHGWLTSVYGFFGTVMQRRIELAHQMNDVYQLGREGEIRKAATGLPTLFKNFLTYVVVPTAIEEYVTGLTTDDRQGFGTHLGKAAVRGTLSSFLYFRDLAYAFTTGHDPSVGLLTSPLHDMQKAVADVGKGTGAFNRQHAGKSVQDFLTVFGEATGLAPKEFANIARFGIDYANRQAHPKEVTDWLRGLTRGTEKKRVEK